ncbi:hypothetical protein MKEN_00309100 [Mycena kentingensis (nom. inval.)]|nr:hypothetical protein MKEN_00309100 [Mycena kentingensis (nom. inval.)]
MYYQVNVLADLTAQQNKYNDLKTRVEARRSSEARKTKLTAVKCFKADSEEMKEQQRRVNFLLARAALSSTSATGADVRVDSSEGSDAMGTSGQSDQDSTEAPPAQSTLKHPREETAQGESADARPHKIAKYSDATHVEDKGEGSSSISVRISERIQANKAKSQERERENAKPIAPSQMVKTTHSKRNIAASVQPKKPLARSHSRVNTSAAAAAAPNPMPRSHTSRPRLATVAARR